MDCDTLKASHEILIKALHGKKLILNFVSSGTAVTDSLRRMTTPSGTIYGILKFPVAPKNYVKLNPNVFIIVTNKYSLILNLF
jgi:hypothetical protein